MLRVTKFDGSSPPPSWEAYVQSNASSITDGSAWSRVLRDTYGLRTFAFECSDGGHTRGALTLTEVRHPLFGHYLLTAPFASAGGLLYESAEARDRLTAAGRKLADELDVDYLVLRTRGEGLPGFVAQQAYVNPEIELGSDRDALWSRHLPSKTRNQIRKGQKSGFELQVGGDQVSAFVDVVHAHMRVLGSPAHGRRFYDALVAQLADDVDVFVARHDTDLAAGALQLYVNGVAMNLQAASLRRFNRQCVNYLLYWSLLTRAIERGCHTFDMGRSVVGSTNLKFKRNWGPRETPLSYNFYLRNKGEAPFVDPRNPKYALAIAAWQRLPLTVTRRLGPLLIRGLA